MDGLIEVSNGCHLNNLTKLLQKPPYIVFRCLGRRIEDLHNGIALQFNLFSHLFSKGISSLEPEEIEANKDEDAYHIRNDIHHLIYTRIGRSARWIGRDGGLCKVIIQRNSHIAQGTSLEIIIDDRRELNDRHEQKSNCQTLQEWKEKINSRTINFEMF